MEDKKLTEKESIEVIASMIAQTKHRYIGDGNILLMWGYLVATVSILVWVLLASTHQNAWNGLWLAIPVIGVTATSILVRRQKREYGVVTYSDKITSQLWTIFGISEIILSLICLGFQFLGGVYCWNAILTYTLIAAPAAEIAQGLIIKERSLTAGGIIGLTIGLVTICCACGDIVLERETALRAQWIMPLFVMAFVAMMIIPGHILNTKAHKGK